MPTIDFSSVQGLDPIPVGQYAATITEATETTSKAGNAMINLKWKIQGGKFADRMIFDTLVFAPQTLFRAKAALLGLGFPKTFKGSVGPQDLIGKSAQITVDIEASTQLDPDTNEPYAPRNRVKKIRSLASATSAKKQTLIVLL